jgi:hypothetical protein
MQDMLWMCRDGRVLRVSQMTDSHLRNAIRMIEARRTWRREYLSRLYLEIEIRAMGLRLK